MMVPRRIALYNWLTSILPEFGVFTRFRKKILRWAGVIIPQSSRLIGIVRFGGDGEVVIGENCTLRHGCFIYASGGGRIELGDNVKLGENVILECRADSKSPGTLSFGSNVDFMMGSIASANGTAHVSIGNHCKIAHNVSVKTTEHCIDPQGECIGGNLKYRDIVVSDGCWIGAGATILPGVRVGMKNVLAAGAVVTKSSPDGVLLAGVPAVVKKQYLASNG